GNVGHAQRRNAGFQLVELSVSRHRDTELADTQRVDVEVGVAALVELAGIDLVEADAKLVEDIRTEDMQMLEGDVVVFQVLCAREIGIDVVDQVRSLLRGEAPEYAVLRAEVVIEPGKVLILIE